SECRDIGGLSSCSCLQDYIGSPPNCRAECTIHSDCSTDKACIRQKCKDPCPGSCGSNAECNVFNHIPACSCLHGFTGDPYTNCFPKVTPQYEQISEDKCNPSPCGANAECNNGVCSCLTEYRGNPYIACRPECVLNTDCPSDKSCLRNKCVDPCIGTCGQNAICTVYNHIPMCSCTPNTSGNAFVICLPVKEPTVSDNPCNPSPCGPNSYCRKINGQAVCSCISGYKGSPPSCRPECIVSSDCDKDKACSNLQCINPCIGTCGIGAQCRVVNHNPICSCLPNLSGDPFVRCDPILETPPVFINPCKPSPCGLNALCQVINNSSSCACMEEHIGSPPNCRPECISNAECSSQLACINQKCKDPCPGSCGPNAECRVVSHTPMCACSEGYTGDPFIQCNIQPLIPTSPCTPSPCGSNAICKEQNGVGSCTCLPEFIGNPYEGCRPECLINSNCPSNLGCIRSKCQDPCPGICGSNANCQVINHLPTCTCVPGFTGDPFRYCQQVQEKDEDHTNPCDPSPCGPNSQCRVISNNVVCSCLPEYSGIPPSCRPECVMSSECPSNKACVNKKCINPCDQACGQNTDCSVINHNPICTCKSGLTGDPLTRCFPNLPSPNVLPTNPCIPSPCGPYSECRNNAGTPSCSCLSTYIGSPPYCRPECVINSDCPSDKSCIREKCLDPCPGSCGTLAQCSVFNHIPICTCPDGYTGDPFSYCVLQPPTPSLPADLCNPSPCGPNTNCNEGKCTCLAEYQGDPYTGCRPECVLNADCSLDKACLKNKCVDPCIGTCGQNALCNIYNHIPMCTCPIDPVVSNPCNPTPCGPNSQCREINGQAVCTCLLGFLGSPPTCRPECITSTDCSPSEACINQKCRNPCVGTCGIRAICQVVNHNPICSCQNGLSGDPFVRCIPQPETPLVQKNPCTPSPCGPNAQCQVINDTPSCSCLAEFIGTPPNCRPECISNNECNNNLACIKQKCKDPCPGSCGANSECRTVSHTPMCTCIVGYTGDPFTQCIDIVQTHIPMYMPQVCVPSPCGANAICKERNGVGSCNCLPDYIGNPYEGCRPECTINSDCIPSKACVQSRCQDPCPGTCGQNAICQVVNHIAMCTCIPKYTGDPFRYCSEEPITELSSDISNPCQPSPCGPNSICRENNGQAVCTCLAEYVGSPPACRPECVASTDCAPNRACVNRKCIDPCLNSCGKNTICRVINHSPLCSCQSGFTGDPFSICFQLQRPLEQPQTSIQQDPCLPSPCGPYSECRSIRGNPSCSCLSTFIGTPPNCRPECIIHSECSSHLACIRSKCSDPCPGSCGVGANCAVVNHIPICTCPEGYTGDPFSICTIKQSTTVESVDSCNPSPCGPNANCFDGICTCISEYEGDAYIGCRPECISNTECSRDKACIRNKCYDPCIGTCGLNAECKVINHVPMCNCPIGMTGNAFITCNPQKDETITRPCTPSPCGPNSQCQEINGIAVCKCLSNYIGNPPTCRPECTLSSDCDQTKACINQKCKDPCPGSCGLKAECSIVNHNPICTCRQGYTGDPFTACNLIVETSTESVNPCYPSPCGLNAQCQVINQQPSCSCLPEFLGSPPKCRPECTTNSDCPSRLSCINRKCKDPCPGLCGANAECYVNNHITTCTCSSGFTGDPFLQCTPVQNIEPIVSPCTPSPCGANALCKEQSGIGSCTCLQNYIGNPYEGCRPECVINSDCPANRACIRSNCQDPCPGACGQNSLCQVINHAPTCTCIPGYTGNPFSFCNIITEYPVIEKDDPCNPSPCGPNSECRKNENQAVCSCLSNYIGSPPACRPECIVSTECPLNKACIKQKCVNPCPNLCGINTDCRVINHSPICICKTGYSGDPFTACFYLTVTPEKVPDVQQDPCLPSPCGPNSLCQSVGQIPSCTCLQNYFGSPPNCRPECTINSECPSNKACIQNKCRDPCPGSCGFNAQCTVFNHVPICSCFDGYTGDPFDNCHPQPPPQLDEIDACNPSPCGINTQCENGICSCLPEYYGDPTTGCRPECVLNSDCVRTKACINNKCKDPCIGTCASNALCNVINHIPMCSCPINYEGNAFVYCQSVQASVTISPCTPSPCGPNSQCRASNDQAVCSCVQGFIGTPPMCRPECIVSTECPANEACTNQKCRNPCIGTCGIGSKCIVKNHNPICYCPDRYTGDPFVRCNPIPELPPVQVNHCQPSPCGPNSLCQVINDSPSCSCLPNYIGSPPQCRPECISNSECRSNQACINQKCKDPCTDSCGINAECRTITHTPMCFCPVGYTGDPFVQCITKPIEGNSMQINPCLPSPCGPNAVCIQRNGAGSCSCLSTYTGNPYEGCRPECVLNSDCTQNKVCVNSKCIDPCPGTCGSNANCNVVNHIATCSCLPSYTGDPYRYCFIKPPMDIAVDKTDPCSNAECGPNSKCRVINEVAVCSCLPTYVGRPPACRPECVSNSDCPATQSCVKQKCTNLCPSSCGLYTDCRVINHAPLCSCSMGYTGDPFTVCFPIPLTVPTQQDIAIKDPCIPSPCGPYAECQNTGGLPSCACLSTYIGSPPNCRPECTINSDCSSNNACIQQKCKDPCPGSCGIMSECKVLDHIPICSCINGYTGDPFRACYPQQPEPVYVDPCAPSPCGSNAKCIDGACTCLDEYFGDPYVGCRPECILNTDCDLSKACVRNKCINPCIETCGQNALCNVYNHIPMCSCPLGMSGNAFVLCSPIQAPSVNDPCNPSPCGPNSLCKQHNSHATCTCIKGYIGAPPTCRPECVVSSDCAPNEACSNQKCIDPCPGSCGRNTICNVINHNPICSCLSGMSGDPFINCSPIPTKPEISINSCLPSPCGPNARCEIINENPSCFCLPEFNGSPPNCRPECISNSECSSRLACINQKCRDPCIGSCGDNAICNVVSHTPMCACFAGYTGDPFTQCSPERFDVQTDKPAPCTPSPCGANAICREQANIGSCSCLSEYIGNPYEGCRPECILNSDCPSNRACINMKCKDPCPGMCSQNANCYVINHAATCTCFEQYTGDPFINCNPVLPTQADSIDTCQSNLCGPYSQCKENNGQISCSCLSTYIGVPPNCKPECTISTDCPSNQACRNKKCIDPCLDSCGLYTTCKVINHNPICSCKSGYTGDPFTICIFLSPIPQFEPEKDPCIPSPCGPNSHCRNVNGSPSCTCMKNYIGSPPQCRPECTTSIDCASNLACIQQKCQDPCPGSCGLNAVCTVHNHLPICSCFESYTGDPFVSCQYKPISQAPLENDVCSLCGPNSECKQKTCVCISEYHGDPYVGCRPECVLSSDCSINKACIRNKCIDPCIQTCGQNAICNVFNHVPMCSCPYGTTGNALISCQTIKAPPIKTPCQPSPCGPNSICQTFNDQAVCACLPNYLGAPPMCRPECTINSDCRINQVCRNQKCEDPCPGTCGLQAKCIVVNHNPICSCPERYTGNPFIKCDIINEVYAPIVNPCQPSPCGPYAICQVVNESPSCSCLPEYKGSPPNCKPECISNSECPANQVCIKQKCTNPCPSLCGTNAECHVVHHIVHCVCPNSYTGDPYTSCSFIINRPEVSPCSGNICGTNAICKEQNNAGVCYCPPDYIGNPYEECRPACVINPDCPSNQMCVQNKCRDPCPGMCGQNAECAVVNHQPFCTCRSGYTGDPFSFCNLDTFMEEKNVCSPSPCGPNSQCKDISGQPVCSCLPTYVGNPPGCRPECVVSSDCPSQLACKDHKCINPCPSPCGLNTKCIVVNHSPICSCAPGYSGNPFTVCTPIPSVTMPDVVEKDPCVPSPCGRFSQCRNIGSTPACTCLETYIGQPPNCKPECTINSECASDKACFETRCRDPCPGSCGSGAVCTVVNHIPMCTCPTGYTGDPFTLCRLLPATTPTIITANLCNPSPCGPNAKCSNGTCTCLPDFQGNPYQECRPECVLNSDCLRDQACSRNKCINPCIGACAVNALCNVINHIPMCSCPGNMTGNAFSQCIPVQGLPPINPCSPGPCGPNSECRVVNGQAVCSCIKGYLGIPPTCRPECIVSTDCPQNEACNNQKCVDPCPGSCGIEALCNVVNHNPICSCPLRYTGDPFVRCMVLLEQQPPIDPCQPSPCGPNSQCQIINNSPSCSCLPEFSGSPPNCRPECINNNECITQLACINQKCKDPCIGACGSNANCHVVSHTPMCTCMNDYTGDPFTQCTFKAPTLLPEPGPCDPSPCGSNAICKELNRVGSCACLPGYIGNPYEGCRPECILNSDCSANKACINSKCTDPCPGTCGLNAECQVINHLPICNCYPRHTGNPFTSCKPIEMDVQDAISKPCNPSPCGPNSECRVVNGQSVCTCLADFIGIPPRCRPECSVSAECYPALACINRKCMDPCPGSCGLNARCEVINHNAICSCQPGFMGDPLISCFNIPTDRPDETLPIYVNPCGPSPCGPYSECRDINGQASCACSPNYIGAPPNCRPECINNSECPSNEACIQKKCQYPCNGVCGIGATCSVINHIPVCTCPDKFNGDPFDRCIPKIEDDKTDKQNPCAQCGANTQCINEICTCLPEYQGDPYLGCRPECVLNFDCSRDKACINNKCKNPCTGICGRDAICTVANHIPICTCPSGMSGNPFVLCSTVEASVEKDPCNPSPCGSNSQCKRINDQAVCSCIPGYLDSPPNCRPECIISSDCPSNMACNNQKCIDPCRGTCGIRAQCLVINHNPICSCPGDLTGDPFTMCIFIHISNPCEPSPCGANSQCRVVNNAPSCSCLPEFIGSPPNCKPECISNSQCTTQLACINQKCRDPCPGSCGVNAECRVISHTPMCVCTSGFVGDPFVQCTARKPEEDIGMKVTPCLPSPCGSNALCRESNGVGSCLCLPNYIGNPYEGCRPECIINSDCIADQACIRSKCQNPCSGFCGQNSVCQVVNHAPLCTCQSGYTGNPFLYCNIVEELSKPTDPCVPSPCGLNSQCRVSNNQAICSCLPTFIGTPPACRPECTVSSDCSTNRACKDRKCIDPCPGICGINARCEVINHSPICSCKIGSTGDPFVRCFDLTMPLSPRPEPINPCIPSPCGPFSVCQDNKNSGIPSCTCMENYIGSPPNCRPECTIDSECISSRACLRQKCTDPCPGSCGIGANCYVINHMAMCVCPNGYTGDPFVNCVLEPELTPVLQDPCRLSPCGSNAICHNGTCTCLPEYHGDPYYGCRPECVQNPDCLLDKACVRNKCSDPCSEACGKNAQCIVINHTPMCSCPDGMSGNAFASCYPVKDPEIIKPCNPSPCGPNSRCQEFNGQAICSCVIGYIGNPPACRPECTVNTDCALNEACINMKCRDPCPGSCGISARCQVINHNPICSCAPVFTGDPFVRCIPKPDEIPQTLNPCQPTPCGPNSHCQVRNNAPSCTCQDGFIGTPPNCRPECISNSECSNYLSCINRKCIDPCPS
ncbi:hypothetical protein M0802_014155, partial [Mischocyttarus mexicanus]